MDIKYRIKQLNILHWVFLVLAVLVVIIPLLLNKDVVEPSEYSEIIYPPNLETIILIDSEEYRKLEALAEAERAKKSIMCYEIGPFEEHTDVSAVSKVLSGHRFTVAQQKNSAKQVIGYWVYLKPERSLALGRLKVEEIKLKGLKDVALLIRNTPRYAISLGLFKAKEFATKRMLRAQALGLDAKMDVRYKDQSYTWLELKVARKDDLAQHEWLKILNEYGDIELKTVSCK